MPENIHTVSKSVRFAASDVRSCDEPSFESARGPVQIQQLSLRNHLLRFIRPNDFELLRRHFQPVELAEDFVLAEPNARIDHVFFLESGIASDVFELSDGRQAEACLYGCEGFSGCCLLYSNDRSPYRQIMRVTGRGFRIETSAFRDAIDHSDTLKTVLLNFAHVLNLQAGFSTISNGSFYVTERIARRLLMYQDRLGDTMWITHTQLAAAMNMRRAGITDGFHRLEGIGAIEAARGCFTIIDRNKLVEAAGTYGPPEAEYERLIGPWRIEGSLEQLGEQRGIGSTQVQERSGLKHP